MSGTSTEGTDYEGFGSWCHESCTGTLTFEPGETRKEIEITIKDDNLEDSGEYFSVFLYDLKPTSVVRFAPDSVGRFRFTQVTIINDEADLGGLTVQGAPGVGGPYSNLDIGTFAAATTDYAVTVPYGTTHARLVPTTPLGSYQDLKAGTGSNLTAVRSGAAGPAVALAVGDTVLVVQSTASTGEQQDLPGDGDPPGAGAVVERRPVRAVGRGRRGRQLDGTGHRRLCGGDDGVCGDGAARDDAGAADSDGGRRRRPR